MSYPDHETCPTTDPGVYGQREALHFGSLDIQTASQCLLIGILLMAEKLTTHQQIYKRLDQIHGIN